MNLVKDLPLFAYLQQKFDIDKYINHFIASIFIVFVIYYFSNKDTSIFTILTMMSILLTMYLMKIEKDMQERLNKKIKIVKKRLKLIRKKMKK